jgi:hypothetical protein
VIFGRSVIEVTKLMIARLVMADLIGKIFYETVSLDFYQSSSFYVVVKETEKTAELQEIAKEEACRDGQLAYFRPLMQPIPIKTSFRSTKRTNEDGIYLKWKGHYYWLWDGTPKLFYNDR